MPKQLKWEREVFSGNATETTGCIWRGKKNLDPYLMITQKLRCTRDVNVKPKTITLLVLKLDIESKTIKEYDKLDFIKIRISIHQNAC